MFCIFVSLSQTHIQTCSRLPHSDMAKRVYTHEIAFRLSSNMPKKKVYISGGNNSRFYQLTFDIE